MQHVGAEQPVPERVRGVRGNLQELPTPTRTAEELASSVLDALHARSLSQTALCCQLSLSPVYFSIWLKSKPMPDLTKQLYSSAVELWLEDAEFHILDPSLTRTNPSQVPKTKGDKSSVDVKERPPPEVRDGPGGRAKGVAPKGSKQERDQLSAPTTPYGLLSELLSASPSGTAPSSSGSAELAFQLHSATRPLPSALSDGGSTRGGAGAGSLGAGGVGAALVNEAEASLLIVRAKLVLDTARQRSLAPDAAASEAPATAGQSTAVAKGRGAGAGGNSGDGGSSGACGGSPGSGGSTQVLWIEFRREGDSVPLAVLLANGTMRAPGDVPSTATEPGRAAVLALSERPQRYRRTPSHHRLGVSSERSQLARALADSRRTAAAHAALVDAVAAASAGPGDTGGAAKAASDTAAAAGTAAAASAAAGTAAAPLHSATGLAAALPATVAAANAATVDTKAIRRQLLSTLQAMAAAPLQLRQRRRQALDLAAAWGEESGMWVGFCSCCGRHFERLEGPEQLAAHAGVHLVHSHLQRVRREELPPTLGRLRAAATVGAPAEALRHELEGARRLGRLVPDASLQRALVVGEARLRVLERPRAGPLPPSLPMGHSGNALADAPADALDPSHSVALAAGLPAGTPLAMTPEDAAGSPAAKRPRLDDSAATSTTAAVAASAGTAAHVTAAAVAPGSGGLASVVANDERWKALLPSLPFMPVDPVTAPLATPVVGPFGIGIGSPAGIYPPAHCNAYANALISLTGHLPQPPPLACTPRVASGGALPDGVASERGRSAGCCSVGTAMSSAPPPLPVSTYSAPAAAATASGASGAVTYNVLDTRLCGNWPSVCNKNGRQPPPSAQPRA